MIAMLLLRFAVLLMMLTLAPGTVRTSSPPLRALADDAVDAVNETSTAAFSPGRADFAVQVRTTVIPYQVMGLFVQPGESIPITVQDAAAASFTLHPTAGRVRPTGLDTWTWAAPETPGLYPLTVTHTQTGAQIRLNAFVLTPFDHRDRRLNDYRIGHYARRPLRDNPVYARPEGFVRLTAANRDVRVAPHFTLGQFACKQTDDLPQYLLLREPLLIKLERILEAANARGHAVSTLHVMSGFRTPYYNRAIGNRTDYSRHLYGGAADIFIDADGNGYMDDLNADGAIDKADAHVLAGLVEAHATRDAHQSLVGGLGIYGPAPHRGPFVHVDARGYRARW